MGKSLGSAFIWSAAQTVVRLVVGFLSIKVTAVYLGPTGIALTSQLNNVFGLIRSTIGNAVEDGVVTLTAKHGETDPVAQRRAVSTAARWLLLMSVVAGGVTVLLSPLLAKQLLGDSAWAPLFVLLAAVLPLSLFGQLVVSVFSGLRRFELVALAQIGITILGTGLLVGCSIQWGLKGGLIATLCAYALILFVAGGLAHRTGAFHSRDLFGPWDSGHAKVMFSYYPMLLAHAAALPMSTLVVRSLMIDDLGADATGLWQGAMRLSDMYTLIITTALNMYSLPTLSATRTDRDLRREMVGLVAKIGLGMIVIATTLFVMRNWIVQIVFTKGFEPVGEIWRFQLVADVLQLMCVPLRQALMVRQRTMAYVAVEALVAIAYVTLTYALIARNGVQAATMANAVAWGLCMVTLFWLNRGVLSAQEPRP
jgi:polysaccharide transporter, PST family